MMLIQLSGGPLDGQERDIESPDMLTSRYPGYAAVEQVMEPERGQVLKTEWSGNEIDEAHYPDSEQERERYGNETGARETETEGETEDRSATS